MTTRLKQGRTNAVRSARQMRPGHQQLLAAWQGTPIGTPVAVVLKDGRLELTKTTTLPAALGGRAVVWLSGLAGWYSLSRVRRLDEDAQASA